MSSSARPHPSQTGHTRLSSLTGSETDRFQAHAHSPLPQASPTLDDELLSQPIGLGVNQRGPSAVQLVPSHTRALEDEEGDDGLAGGDDDDDEDAGTIREVSRRHHGHAKSHSNGSPGKWKGKGKAVDVDLENGMAVPTNVLQYEEVDTISPTNSYPPVSDEVVEERKITENLKRWEELDRQRRKAARDSRRSRSDVPSDPSMSAGGLADVTRRASLLFRARSGRRRGGAAGSDRSSVQSMASDAPLRPHSLASPIDDGDAELGVLSQPTTPSTTGSGTVRSPNPFSPQTSPLSTRQSYGGNSVKARPKSHTRPPHTSSISSAFADVRSSDEDPFSSRSSLEQSHQKERPLPALPESDIQVSSLGDARWQPPLAREMSTSDTTGADGEAGEEEPRGRRWWWMDYVCGCGGEETDDEDQAGRTNPFE